MKLHPDIERLALLGWHMYPCTRASSKKACIKQPSDKATCDLDQLAQWQDDFRHCNWRVVCGPSQIWGLDLDIPSPDHKSDGVAAFQELAKPYEALPRRPMTRSGGGGLALFFRHNGEPIAGQSGYPAGGIDPHRGRQPLTVPPSIHHRTGLAYRWLIPPWETSPPDAPDWLLRLVRPPPEPEYKRDPNVVDDTRARRALIRAMQIIRDAPSGSANDTLNRRAYYVARCVGSGALGEAEAVEALYAAALDRAIPRPEARATIKSAFRRGLSRPLEKVA